jgi:alpha-aminoadipate carrier protein LysW
MAHCPECDATIDVEDDEIEEGQTLDCPECGAELEVVSTNPLELNLVSSDDEEEEGSW